MSEPPKYFGELLNPEWTYQFFDLATINPGQLIAPGKIDSDLGREYSALCMVVRDLEFALACFQDAAKLGPPDSRNVVSRALIYSAVIAYARSFKSGVRQIRLEGDFFAAVVDWDGELHEYLLDIRDKHVAHSVNEFETCHSTSVMVGTPDRKQWRFAGIGFSYLSAIGLSPIAVSRAASQIEQMLVTIANLLNEKRAALYAEQRTQFDQHGIWEPAEFMTLPDRANVKKSRPKGSPPKPKK